MIVLLFGTWLKDDRLIGPKDVAIQGENVSFLIHYQMIGGSIAGK